MIFCYAIIYAKSDAEACVFECAGLEPLRGVDLSVWRLPLGGLPVAPE